MEAQTLWAWPCDTKSRHPRASHRCSGETQEVEAHLVKCLAQQPSWAWARCPGAASGHSGRLDHTLVSVEDVALERQAELHMLRGLQPLSTLLLLGCLPSASTASLLEGRCQDLLGLGTEATYKSQRGSMSLCHLPPWMGTHAGPAPVPSPDSASSHTLPQSHNPSATLGLLPSTSLMSQWVLHPRPCPSCWSMLPACPACS